MVFNVLIDSKYFLQNVPLCGIYFNMDRIVIQLPKFSEYLDLLISEQKISKKDFEDFEWSLVKNPQQGVVIPGLNGLRKTRLKSAFKGKRSGFRIDYLDIPEKSKLYLIVIYPKNIKEDLSFEEKRSQDMGKMFNLLKEGLEEAIKYEQGFSKKVRIKKIRIDAVEVPKQPKEYQAKDILELRKKMNCSQSLMAAYMNVSPNTIQAWEQGVRRPSHSALRLIEIMDKGPTFLASLINKKPKSKHVSQ